MKKFSKKSALLFAGAMAVCAFVMPSMASAASWGTIGTHHTLDSPNVGFTSSSPLLGPITSQCNRSSFTANVRSAADLQITAASFGGLCTASGPGLGDCTVTTQATNLPWTGTAVTTSNIQIHGVDIDIRFETLPTGGVCNANGASAEITGTLTGGNWTGNATNSLDFNNSEGLTSHGALSAGVTARGFFRDTNGLTVS